ncbi:uncharacterized protein [Porites lutea]|uniref:uncharacterized protein n=1 Tax=Porites lutea TaxID=51062 RepID=UPI003CC53D50
MASATPSYASTKETTNFAHLCRLLVDVGSQALRNKFDSIHPPAGLHGVLTKPPAHPTLQMLRKKRILNPTQWAKLYPPTSSVSSNDFDVTLLMLLLRNICGLTPPATGWDSLPPATDTSAEANIARVKYYRNHVYGHASQASVDDPTFHSYWQDISKALVGLGADAAAITKLKTESMDPVIEKHYQELLREWKKDEDNIKDQLDKIEDSTRDKFEDIKVEMTTIRERLDTLTPAGQENNEEGAFDPTEYVDGIRQLYKIREGWLAPFPWCEEFRFNLDNIFTRLKIVSRKKERGTKTCETVSMDDIFKPHEECPQPRTVLIEGDPGIGKTTYCNKLAYDWATMELEKGDETSSGGSFPKFKVVLSLKCRDIKSDVSDAIEEQHLYGTPKEKEEELFKSLLWDAIDDQLLPRGVTKQEKEEFFKFVRHNQQDVLLVLDGLDELPICLLPAFKEIIQGRMLPKCHIVVTARHEVGMKVRECCDTLLEIEGFTQLDARVFIAKYFKTESQLAQKLLDKIDLDDNLRQLTKSPLNTALLCLLCEDFDGIFPQSGTQLYVEIVECVLRRYRKKKGLPDPKCKDLIDIYKIQLKQLGRIAWKGLLYGNFFFEKSEFENCGDGLLEYGFLSVERGRSKRRPSLYYCFLHKTFQELFAAFHLCCDVLNNEHIPENLIPENKYFVEFRQVLEFTCGLLASQSEEMVKALFARIADNVNCDEEFLIALKCIDECKNEKNSTMHMSLACSLGLLLQVTKMNLSVKHNSTITQLDLSGNSLGFGGGGIVLADAVKHNSTITQLNLSGNSLGGCALPEAIKHNSTITHLNLSCNFFGLGDLTALAEAIKHNSTIRQLDLSENGLGDDGLGDDELGDDDFAELAKAIKHNSTIIQLDLSKNRISDGNFTALADAIKHNSTIRQLGLSENCLGDYAGDNDCTELAEAIKHNSSITQLDLSKNHISDGNFTALADAIKHNSSIRQLDLSENYLGFDDCTPLADAIKHNSTITQLNLARNSIGCGDNLTELADAIRHNSTITQLNLSENYDLGDCDCSALVEVIKHNSTITHLNLSSNSLPGCYCISLAEAVKHNVTIRQLDLSWNIPFDDNCTVLAEAIKHNSTIYI